MTNQEFQILVLEQLKGLGNSIGGLEKELKGLNNTVVGLEGELKGLNNTVVGLDGELKGEIQGLKNSIDELKNEQSKTNHIVNGIHEQVAELTEFRSETKENFDKLNNKIDILREDLNAIEIVTSKNWNDIAKLKAVR